jgi:hypothetical protein
MSNLKIDLEDFNRKAQHILETVVKPQVERYEQSKKNEMGILKDKANQLKNDLWYKKLRRWLKFKLWVWKHELNKSE